MNLISTLKILNNVLVDFFGPFLARASPAVTVILFQEIRTGRKMLRSFFFQRMCVSVCFWGRKGASPEDPEALLCVIMGLL